MVALQDIEKIVVGFVMAGGGAQGVYQARAAVRLIEGGFIPHVISGVSVGALNAAMIAQGSRDRLLELWRTVRAEDVYEKRFLGALQVYMLGKQSLYKSDPLQRLIEREVDFEKIRDLKSPKLLVIACDILKKERVVFDNATVDAHALLGSTAIPGLFPPVPHGNHLLIDGGVTNNAPIGAAIDGGATIIVSISMVPALHKPVDRSEVSSGETILKRSIEMEIEDNIETDSELAECRNSCQGHKKIMLFKIRPNHRLPMDILEFDPKKARLAEEQADRDVRRFFRNPLVEEIARKIDAR